eukprot:scaffold102844_cov17-Prasinocladus_malaysianus.AAC.1
MIGRMWFLIRNVLVLQHATPLEAQPSPGRFHGIWHTCCPKQQQGVNEFPTLRIVSTDEDVINKADHNIHVPTTKVNS